MTKQRDMERFKTGLPNLDEILSGGFPKRSVTVVGGTPGSGKTILTQQMAFHNATPDKPAIFFQTLSEPLVKTMTYLTQFDFFDQSKVGKSVFFVDLGDIMRGQGLEKATSLFMEHIKKYKPAFVSVDSFKVFSDLAKGKEDLRKFSYEIVTQLLVWECTAFLLGEFSQAELATNPLSSICDGILNLDTRELSGEQQRFIRVVKMRGTDHSRECHPIVISDKGINVYFTKPSINSPAPWDGKTFNYSKTGIKGLDALLGDGISEGSSLVVAGVAGTGKTLLTLEILYRAAKEFGEKGIYFSFEENSERICARAKKFGWDLDDLIKRKLLKIVFVPQNNILVERDILMINDEIKNFSAKRVVIDSTSVLLSKIESPQILREKLSQLYTVLKNAKAIGFFCTNIPYGSAQISRFGVEETLADGIIILNSLKVGNIRKRSLEIYKLRDSKHQEGEFPLEIKANGFSIKSGRK